MKVKVEFADDGGAKVVATFDNEAGTVVVSDGRKANYSHLDGSKIVELRGDDNLSITFAEAPKLEQGFSSRYTSSDGRAGLATVLSTD